MPKRYLTYPEVTNTWDKIQVNWEDIYVVYNGSSTARWMQDNPWNKPWTKSEWRQLTDEERRRVLERHGITGKNNLDSWQ